MQHGNVGPNRAISRSRNKQLLERNVLSRSKGNDLSSLYSALFPLPLTRQTCRTIYDRDVHAVNLYSPKKLTFTKVRFSISLICRETRGGGGRRIVRERSENFHSFHQYRRRPRDPFRVKYLRDTRTVIDFAFRDFLEAST